MEKKVVVTDSLFSMDGDFAPLPELVKLRRKYGFLLVIDDVSILSSLKYSIFLA
jgi:8-amino-7-oxononanoate synthase